MGWKVIRLWLRILWMAGLLAGVALGAAPAGSLGPIAELKLEDGTVLHEVVIIGYANKVVTARWQGGRGTILHSQLPWEWRKVVEARRPVEEGAPQSTNVKVGPGGHIVIVATPEVKLTGRMQLSPVEEGADAYYFTNAKVSVYPLKEGQEPPPIMPGPAVDLGEPLATTQTDEQGRWVMPPFPKQPYYVQAVGVRTVEKTGYSTSWEWRIQNVNIVEVSDLILDEDNAFPVVRAWSKKHSSVIRREEREKKKSFLKRIFGVFSK